MASRQPLRDVTNLPPLTPTEREKLQNEVHSGRVVIPIEKYNEMLDRVRILETVIPNLHLRIHGLEVNLGRVIGILDHSIYAQGRLETEITRLCEWNREFCRPES